MFQWNHLTCLLQHYEGASGQRLSNNKTTIFFSKNTLRLKRKEL
jgi:hypothetical protein